MSFTLPSSFPVVLADEASGIYILRQQSGRQRCTVVLAHASTSALAKKKV